MVKSAIFESQRNDLYCVIFLLLLLSIWTVLDEFSVLQNICGMIVAKNGNTFIFQLVTVKFQGNYNASKLFSFFSFNYLHACVKKKKKERTQFTSQCR